MDIFYDSDWHIHSEASYDADLKVPDLIKCAKTNGIKQFGITDHVNYPFMVKHLERSRDLFLANKTEGFHLGVELTTLPKSQYDFALKHPSDPDCREKWLHGYIPPIFKKDGIALSLSEEEINRCQVEYVVAGAHWSFGLNQSRKGAVKSYQQQQIFIAQQSYVDIIAHPWWIYMGRYVKNGIQTGPWFDDFSIIPKSIHEEFAAAVLGNNKIVELNTDFFVSDCYTDYFKRQYAEYLCMLHEKGVQISIGSDLHSNYTAHHKQVRHYMEPLGFTKDTFAVPRLRKYQNKSR